MTVQRGAPDREQAIEQAHLLILRSRLDEARALIDVIGAASPGDPEVNRLRAEWTRAEEKRRQRSLSRRDWRWRLGLSTGWQRALATILGLLVVAYGAWSAGSGVQVAAMRGLTARVTSRVRTGSRLQHRTRIWTRPAYVDIVYGAVLMLVGSAHVALVRWASRGAEDWEEIDASDPEPRTIWH